MKNKIALVLIITLAFIAGTLSTSSRANEQDEFSTGTLNHGLPFDYFDMFATVESPPDPSLHPKSHFEPSIIHLNDGVDAHIAINGQRVIVESSEPVVIPFATRDNYIDVLNQVRQVLIDKKLAAAPE